MKKIFITVISACLCVFGTSGLAYSDFLTLQLDGIPGESKLGGHDDEIDVISFSWQMSATSVESGGGAGSTIVRPLIIHKSADKASPLLSLALLNGSSIADGILSSKRDGSDYTDVRIKMWDIHVVNLSAEMEGGPQARVIESVALAFSKVCYEYTPFKEDGSPDATVEKCWDIGGNVEF